MIEYDSKERIGWGPFSLPDTHPFHDAALAHDRGYDELIAGTSRITLKELDKQFLRNCLRAATAQKFFGFTYLPPLAWQAYAYYRAARWWAITFRPHLEAFKPKKEIT